MKELTQEDITKAVNAVVLAYQRKQDPHAALINALDLSVKYENTAPGTYLAEFPGGTFPAHISPDGHFYVWTDDGAVSYGKDPRDWPKRVPAVVRPKDTSRDLAREEVEKLWIDSRVDDGLGDFNKLDDGYGHGTSDSVVNTVNAARQSFNADSYDIGMTTYTPTEGFIEVVVPPEVALKAQKYDKVYLTIKEDK